MSNTSATGGYLLPAVPVSPYPDSLTFKQFLQTVFVGISGLDGTLVRPEWQINPPKQPDVCVNWLAIGLTQNKADTNAFTSLDQDGINVFQRQEDLEVQCSFYGPDSDEIAALTRDGFQIPQNLEALQLARMGFVATSQLLHMPELINERWFDRFEMTVYLRREILRTYPILTLVSASGKIHTVLGDELYLLDWQTKT